jgi:hypothetical protein
MSAYSNVHYRYGSTSDPTYLRLLVFSFDEGSQFDVASTTPIADPICWCDERPAAATLYLGERVPVSGMRLIVAEKPSLARAIASAIPGEHRRAQHHITCSTGDVIAWCAGHVLELAPPEDYADALRNWTFETLPIFPKAWKHRVSVRQRAPAATERCAYWAICKPGEPYPARIALNYLDSVLRRKNSVTSA